MAGWYGINLYGSDMKAGQKCKINLFEALIVPIKCNRLKQFQP